MLYFLRSFLLLSVFSQSIKFEFFKISIALNVISSKFPMGVETKYKPAETMTIIKNIIFSIILISLFNCAPTNIPTIKKEPQQTKIQDKTETVTKREKPKDKKINFESIDNVLIFLSDDEILRSLFYDVFVNEIQNYNHITKANFIYGFDEIKEPINNTLIIGPINSEDLNQLADRLGENTFILSLSNDYSQLDYFASNEIIFIPNSPYLHVLKLGPYIENLRSVGVLYKQNDYGLKVSQYFKQTYPLIFTKFMSYGDSATNIELSVEMMGNLESFEKIIVIDDTFSFKDLIGYLATDKKTYPLENIYLIDNFLEQRNNSENYYQPINRTNILEIDLSQMEEPHREYLFKSSVELSLSIADQILKNNFVPDYVSSRDMGNLIIENQMILYPIVFD